MTKGFTLIELLIVVAIIAILAAIAVPNFLEAQVRAKVSRAKADMRSLATALEAYAVDYNKYPPNDGDKNAPPRELSTPVSYITSALLIDPFAAHKENAQANPGDMNEDPYYTYMQIVTFDEAQDCDDRGRPCPYEAIDHWAIQFNLGAFEKYGKWRMLSVGPDLIYGDDTRFDEPLYGSDISYDPTNGTTSFGNILRTQTNL